MTLRHACILLSLAATLPGCATLIDGTSQNVTVSTSPAGAQCDIDRDGARLGTINPTPGSLHVDKSRKDLTVTCAKDGFRTATVAQSASFGGTTFGNLLLGGGVGLIVDAASGADFSYPAEVRLDMAPALTPGAATVASARPTS